MKPEIAICHDSLKRCTDGGEFIDRFYQILMGSSDQVRAKFAKTDFQRQKKTLEMALRMLLMSAQGNDAADVYLEYIAERHDHRHLDIDPSLYVVWLDSLVEAVRASDPQCNADVESAWRTAMKPGIDYMVGKY